MSKKDDENTVVLTDNDKKQIVDVLKKIFKGESQTMVLMVQFKKGNESHFIYGNEATEIGMCETEAQYLKLDTAQKLSE